MNPSPLRSLVARHVCACRTVGRIPASVRLLSTVPPRNAQFSSPAQGYGAAEMLKRRYQATPASVEEAKAEKARIIKRMRYSAYGIVLCALAIFGTIYTYPDPRKEELEKKRVESSRDNRISFDAAPSIPGVPDTSLAEQIEQVPTGTSTIPTFPRTIHLSSNAPASSPAAANNADGVESDVEYQLVGLGIRTVSLFSIQVYVVGLYVAVPDIATLQERLVRSIADPVATTLVSTEKFKLKEALLDPVRGEEIWNDILKDGGIRSAFRIVPTRNTDFMHMRDGFVRGITAKSTHFARDLSDESFSDESFGQSLNDLKAIFGGGARKKIPTGETLLLLRDAGGKLDAVHEDKTNTKFKMGEVKDERVSRLLWLNYLAGASVSSEAARRSVVDGVMEYVERPVGTVATQVV